MDGEPVAKLENKRSAEPILVPLPVDPRYMQPLRGIRFVFDLFGITCGMTNECIFQFSTALANFTKSIGVTSGDLAGHSTTPRLSNHRIIVHGFIHF